MHTLFLTYLQTLCALILSEEFLFSKQADIDVKIINMNLFCTTDNVTPPYRAAPGIMNFCTELSLSHDTSVCGGKDKLV